MAMQTILLHPHLPKRSDNSTSHLNMDLKNAQFFSTFHGWKMFQPDLKSKLLQPFSFATLLLKHMLFLLLGLFYLQLRRMYYLPITKTMSYINLCHSNSLYIGHTSQSLQEHIKQHVSRLIRNNHFSQDCSNLSCACKTNSKSKIIITHDSAIR